MSPSAAIDSQTTSLSVALIPADASGRQIGSRTQQILSTLGSAVGELEVLVVSSPVRDCHSNDGDPDDGSPLRLKEWMRTDDRIRLLIHPQHSEIGPALHTGLNYARLTYALVVSASNPPAPQDLLLYVQAAQEADIVVGRCQRWTGSSPLERAIALGIKGLFGLPVAPFQLTCLYRTEVLHEIWVEYGRSPFVVPEIAIKARDSGARLIEIIVDSAQALPIQPATSVLYDAAHFWLRRLTSRKAGP
jgi:hypothetical protein